MFISFSNCVTHFTVFRRYIDIRSQVLQMLIWRKRKVSVDGRCVRNENRCMREGATYNQQNICVVLVLSLCGLGCVQCCISSYKMNLVFGKNSARLQFYVRIMWLALVRGSCLSLGVKCDRFAWEFKFKMQLVPVCFKWRPQIHYLESYACIEFLQWEKRIIWR